ncbi:MAG: polymer-forming cytoskeletal protein [Pseudomonadota bacterium]
MSNPYDSPAVKHPSVLGPTLKFKGELIADENLLIHGAVEGSIKHSSLLTVAERGQLNANITAEYVAIDGNVTGDIGGSKSVVVSAGADVNGNIYSPVVTLREGAKFNGKIDMSGRTAAPASKKKSSRASAAKSDASVDAKPTDSKDKDSASAA